MEACWYLHDAHALACQDLGRRILCGLLPCMDIESKGDRRVTRVQSRYFFTTKLPYDFCLCDTGYTRQQTDLVLMALSLSSLGCLSTLHGFLTGKTWSAYCYSFTRTVCTFSRLETGRNHFQHFYESSEGAKEFAIGLGNRA